MRPVVEKKKFEIRHIAYIIMIIVCILAIGIGVYMQFFKDEKLGVIFGITKNEEDLELKEIQDNFSNIFTNDIDIVEEYNGNIQKIKEDEELIFNSVNTQEQQENYSIDIKIPYFNIKTDNAIKINQSIKNTFKDKSQSVISSTSTDNTIYTVKYKAYLNSNILSLVLFSELKEGNNNQRIILKAFNYDLEENRETKMHDIITKKNIDVRQANEVIKITIDNSQIQNLKLRELGYPIDVRDSNSEEYKIENAKNFFLGEKGYLYLVYPYGNKELTSEMDLVIIR